MRWRLWVLKKRQLLFNCQLVIYAFICDHIILLVIINSKLLSVSSSMVYQDDSCFYFIMRIYHTLKQFKDFILTRIADFKVLLRYCYTSTASGRLHLLKLFGKSTWNVQSYELARMQHRRQYIYIRQSGYAQPICLHRRSLVPTVVCSILLVSLYTDHSLPNVNNRLSLHYYWLSAILSWILGHHHYLHSSASD